MALSFTEKKRIRKSFGRIPEAIEMPNLIEVQRESYEHFLQMHTPADKRTDDGLGGVFKSVFPTSTPAPARSRKSKSRNAISATSR